MYLFQEGRHFLSSLQAMGTINTDDLNTSSKNYESTQFHRSYKDTSQLIEDEDNDLKCGYFRWKPAWLQRFNTPNVLLMCISWYLFIECKYQQSCTTKMSQL